MVRSPTHASTFLLCSVLLGCSNEGPTAVGYDPIPGVPSCAHPQRVAGVLGETTRVMLDTSEGVAVPLEATQGRVQSCSRLGYLEAPIAVIEYVVPGDAGDAIPVAISTRNDGTDRAYDTVLAVRRGPCEAEVSLLEQTCFDDTLIGTSVDSRASGGFVAQGGETVFVLVSGRAANGSRDRGAVQVDLTASPAGEAPSLSSATAVVLADRTVVYVSGSDPDSDAAGVEVTFLGEGLEVLDTDFDGHGDDRDVLRASFAVSAAGVASFTNEPVVIDLPAPQLATRVWVRLYDQLGLTSEERITTALESGTYVMFGQACDPLHVCFGELQCRSGMCDASVEAAAACAAATPIAVEASTSRITRSVTATLPPGGGRFDSAACVNVTSAAEHVYSLTIPAGTYNLELSTLNGGTPSEASILLYSRSACTNPNAETGCTAFFSDPILQFEALSGGQTLFVFVEYGGGVGLNDSGRYQLDVSLTPILPAGSSCDPEGQSNLCANGACAGGLCP